MICKNCGHELGRNDIETILSFYLHGDLSGVKWRHAKIHIFKHYYLYCWGKGNNGCTNPEPSEGEQKKCKLRRQEKMKEPRVHGLIFAHTNPPSPEKFGKEVLVERPFGITEIYGIVHIGGEKKHEQQQ